jgi:Caspase domain
LAHNRVYESTVSEIYEIDERRRHRICHVLLIPVTIGWLCGATADSRGVRPLAADDAPTAETFEPDQSAALFVGVRRFPYDPSLAEVRYAVDDAIDLACVLALGERARLVDPSRVILALSGEPQKPDSQRNLERLVVAGARVRSAAGPDVLNALDEQSRAVGKKGVLIFAFATHGFTKEGTQYLLSATSIIRHGEGAISESEIRDIASQSDAARSLILIDACRERLTDGRRSGRPDARSAAALLRAMDGVHGQVVLSAAAVGQYAYDDDDRRNGVFTAALIDGLRCQAAADARGLITVDTLSSFVEQHVLTWIRKHRNPRITHATQVSFEGGAKTMPLAECRRIASADQRTIALPRDDHDARVPARALAAVLDTGPPRANQTATVESITVIVFDDRGEPTPQLLAAANEVIRESGYRPISLPRSSAWDLGVLKQLAAGRVESLGGMHLSNVCRAVFAGTVTRSAITEGDASLHGMNATHLHLRFYLIDSGSEAVLSSIDSEARGGGFSKESSEIQAWERAAAILRTEMRKMKWTELLAVR